MDKQGRAHQIVVGLFSCAKEHDIPSSGPQNRPASKPLNHAPKRPQQAWERRYHTWTPEECHTRECQAPLLKTGLIVDIEALWKLLSTKVPAVLRGEPVSALQEPWPKAV